ncbi:MAG: GNAT family N-acetyltransferase, partial [Erysipelotrichaceae bacterium]|nr:GNAT family N-acetyltransferase [Erysipelotrichaceae bacterium]
MKLREYRKEDAQFIINWIKDEEEFYRWSADRFNRYPISGKDLDEHYSFHMRSNRFMPLVMIGDTDELIGQFIIRYPKEDDDSLIRFGFVLIDPQYRGKAYGKKMLELGIEYAKEKLAA